MFETVATIVFLFMTTIWSRDGWTNLIIKVAFALMTAWAFAEAMIESGFVIAA